MRVIKRRLSIGSPSWWSFLAFGVCILVVLGWSVIAGPVLLHTRVFAENDQWCGVFTEQVTGFTVLNPLRSRVPERAAEAFLRAASQGKCLPEWNERTCNYIVTKRPVRAREWRLVYRFDFNSGQSSDLLYEQLHPTPASCRPIVVSLKQVGGVWTFAGLTW